MGEQKDDFFSLAINQPFNCFLEVVNDTKMQQ